MTDEAADRKAGTGTTSAPLLAHAALLERLCALTVAALRCAASYVLVPSPTGLVAVAAADPRTASSQASGGSVAGPHYAAQRARLRETPVLWDDDPAPDAAPACAGNTASIALLVGGEVAAILIARGVPTVDAHTEAAARTVAEFASAALDAVIDRERTARHEVDELLSTLAHEVRGQLNEIVLIQGLLLAGGRLGDLTADQQGRLRQIGRAAGRVAALFESLTDLGRRDRTELAHQTIRFEQVSTALLMELAPELESTPRIQVVAQVPPDLPTVSGDPTVLRTALRTIVQAVIKYSPSGESQVHIGAEKIPSGIAIEVGGDGLHPTAGHSGASAVMPTRRAAVNLALYVAGRLLEPFHGRAELVGQGADATVVRITLPTGRMPSPAS